MRVTVLWCAIASLSAFPAASQDGGVRDFPLTGSAPQVCAIQTGQFRTEALKNFRGTSGDVLRVIELVDSRTLATRAARVVVVIDTACNLPHRVRLESQDNGLWPIEGPIAAPSNGFATALPYQVALVWADRVGVLKADAKIRQGLFWEADIDRPAEGELRLTIELDEGASNSRVGAPVLAGAYGDTLRIFLEPRR